MQGLSHHRATLAAQNSPSYSYFPGSVISRSGTYYYYVATLTPIAVTITVACDDVILQSNMLKFELSFVLVSYQSTLSIE